MRIACGILAVVCSASGLGAQTDSARVTPAGTGASDWLVAVDSSSARSTHTVLASLYATPAQGAQLGDERLVVRCHNRELSIFVFLGWPVAADSAGVARLGIAWNDATLDSTFWQTATNRQALFAPDAKTFLEQGLLRHARLRVQVPKDGSGAPVTYEFALTGIETHVPLLTRSCPSEPTALATRTPDGQGVYFEFQVDKPVAPKSARAPLVYPEELRLQSLEGEVLVQFVVDSTGAPIMASLKILRSTHPLFENAVRTYVRTVRYLPAEIKGQKVNQLVQQPFHFSLRHE